MVYSVTDNLHVHVADDVHVHVQNTGVMYAFTYSGKLFALMGLLNQIKCNFCRYHKLVFNTYTYKDMLTWPEYPSKKQRNPKTTTVCRTDLRGMEVY